MNQEDFEKLYAEIKLFVAPSLTLKDFKDAMAFEGPLALDWEDKPHQLVYLLCKEILVLRNSDVLTSLF